MVVADRPVGMTGQFRGSRRTTRFGCVAALLVVALWSSACGSANEPVDAAGSDSVANATVSELRNLAPPCEAPSANTSIDYGDYRYPLAESDWVQLVGVVEGERDRGDSGFVVPSRVMVEDPRDGRGAEELELQIHPTFWPGIDWGLANGATIYLATTLEYVDENTGLWADVVTVEPVGGVPVFVGECREGGWLSTSLEIAFGEAGAIDLARSIPLMTLDERREALGLVEEQDVEPSGPEIVVLNQEDVDESILAALQFAIVLVRTDRSLGLDFAICSKSSAGWNDCFVPDERAIDPGVAVDGYLDSDGLLEFWLIDSEGDLQDPVRKLGEVVIEPSLRSSHEILVSVDVSLDEGNTDAVTLRIARSVDGRLDETDEELAPLFR